MLRSSYEAHKSFKSQHGSDPNEVWAVHGSDDASLMNIAEYGFNRSYKGKHACSYGLSVCGVEVGKIAAARLFLKIDILHAGQGIYFAMSGNFAYSGQCLYSASAADGTQR